MPRETPEDCEMSIFITGGSGFVGLNLIEQLLAKGETVVNYSLIAPPAAAKARFDGLPGTLHDITGDVCDGTAVDEALRDCGAASVIHGAVITAGTDRERSDARRVVSVNVDGTVNVLNAAQRHGAQRFVYLSSGAVYGDNAFAAPWLGEDTPPLPVTLYAITKYAAERISLRYGGLWDMSVVAARLGGVFGRWEYDTGLRDTLSPPLLATQLAAQGKEVALPHEGKRDWIYGPDVATGILALLEAAELRYRVYNVAPGHEWTLVDWCQKLRSEFPKLTYRVAQREEEANLAFPRASLRAPLGMERLQADTGFRARFGLDEAFADYMEWRQATGL